MAEITVNADRMEQIINVFGSMDENVRIIEQEFGVSIINRDTELKITGDEENAANAEKTIQGLLQLAAKGEPVEEQNVRYVIGLIRSGQADKISALTKDVICITAKGKPIKAKTIGQQQYMKAISSHTITIGVGPAGTGKTYLAVAAAVAGTAGQPHHSDPACSRGGRAAGLPPGRYAEQGGSVPAAAV